ncbi:MAG TPA: type II toxin-antitoxin system VapC family toxin [Candidatus Acidoferrum sp.]|nr:type II toxin-antitoxin system VapC family toxin [Candidatus Acidoferrum sp.]
MPRFVDANIFIYAVTAHQLFGKTAKKILERINNGEPAVTSTIVLCEVAWVLEAMGKQGSIKPTLEKIMSFKNLKLVGFSEDDLLVGANTVGTEHLDFNDSVNLALMMRLGITEIYSNDQKHFGKLDFIELVFA